MIQENWFDLNDIKMVEDTDKTVDVLFENGNIMVGTFHSWIEYFSPSLGGRAHLRKHYFKNSITQKSVETNELSIIGWKFKESR